MRIVFLSRYQNLVDRGAETFVFELSKQLSKRFQVDIFTGRDSDNIYGIIKGNYDIVIPMNGRLQSLKVSLGRLAGKYKLLITGQSGIGRDDIWNIVIARPDVYVSLTGRSYKWAKKWNWGTEVVKIPNGVDLNKFKPVGSSINPGLPKPVILSVGALEWYKFHERLIKAVSELKTGSVLIVGTGPFKLRLEQLGKKLLGGRFRIEQYNYMDMPKVYRACDLFSLPSWDREAFGIAYLEALSSGIGVVAPDDESRREIVGDGGLFTKTDNPSVYAACIEKALKIDWSKKARRQAENFSWEKIAGEYEKIMLNINGKNEK